MTIGSAGGPSPSRDDGRKRLGGDEQQYGHSRRFGSDGLKFTSAKRHDERSLTFELVDLFGRILGNWGATARLLAVVVVALVVTIVGMLLLHVTVDLGAIRIDN